MLSTLHLNAVAEASVKRRYRRGEAIINRGRVSNALFIILSGSASVTITNRKGAEVLLSSLNAGDYVGEMSLVDNQPHAADVRCDTQCDILVLGSSAFASCIRDNPDLSERVLKGLVARLRGAIRQIESLALLDVYGRVARALMDMSQDHQGRRIVPGKISRQRVAKFVGASREMVSRVLVDLEQRGLVQTQADGTLLIRRPNDLAEAQRLDAAEGPSDGPLQAPSGKAGDHAGGPF